jgi:uncharacterized protein YhfF
MSLEKTPSTNAFWNEFLSATGHIATGYTVEAFGDTEAMADELVALVISGKKRATASLLRDYTTRDDPVPQAGDFVVVVDSVGRPRCIWRSTEVIVKPLNDVDDAFAWDEGEGDRTRDWWISAHQDYFSAQARHEGFEMCGVIETVFERFEIVWPPDVAAAPENKE